LDVGAATGEFVKVAREHGFDADGTEFSEYAVEQAKVNGIVLDRLPLEDIRKDEAYDIVHLNHVFEHLTDPTTELTHIRRLLRTNGILYIEIPYQFHPVERLSFLVRRPRADFSLTSLHHPYFYTPRTIRRLLKAHGFDVLRVSLFSAERYQADTAIAKGKKAIWWCLSKVGIGNYIEIMACRSS
jgi:SAM-dependent methyltransferase